MRVNESVTHVVLRAQATVIAYTVRLWVQEDTAWTTDRGIVYARRLQDLWAASGPKIRTVLEELIRCCAHLSAIEVIDPNSGNGYVVYPEWP